MYDQDLPELPERREVYRRVEPLLEEALASLGEDERLAVEMVYVEGGLVEMRPDDTGPELLVHVGLCPNPEGETWWWFAAPASRVGLRLVDGVIEYVPDGNEAA